MVSTAKWRRFSDKSFTWRLDDSVMMTMNPRLLACFPRSGHRAVAIGFLSAVFSSFLVASRFSRRCNQETKNVDKQSVALACTPWPENKWTRENGLQYSIDFAT